MVEEGRSVKDHGVLHPALARILAESGHGDRLALADAGLPIPPGVPRIDLAFAPGQPALLQVLDAVLTELRVEAYVVAEESESDAPWLIEALARRLPDARVIRVDHETLKDATTDAKAVVRTGEFRAYANVLLQSGVDFPRWTGP
jgi:D-ribose pyranase